MFPVMISYIYFIVCIKLYRNGCYKDFVSLIPLLLLPLLRSSGVDPDVLLQKNGSGALYPKRREISKILLDEYSR